MKKVNAEVPFCNDCEYGVDFGPYIITQRGMIPTQVKHIGFGETDEVPCLACPHFAARQELLRSASSMTKAA